MHFVFSETRGSQGVYDCYNSIYILYEFISLTTIQVGKRIKDIKERVFGSASFKHYIRRA
jgi:hypothetical protein